MKMRTFVSALPLVGLAALLIAGGLMWGAANEELRATRDVAAQFLGVAPDHLQMVWSERPVSRHGVDFTSVKWDAEKAQGEDTVRMSAVVSVEHGLVFSARWAYPPATASRSTAPLADRATDHARAFLADRCRVYTPRDELVGVGHYRHSNEFGAEFGGAGPGPNTHHIYLRMKAADYRPVNYSLHLEPPPPPATRPIQISEAEAQEIAARAVAEDFGEAAKHVVTPVRTSSSFAPMGEPVYIVSILVGDTGALLWAVHATTGEVIKERKHLPPMR